MGVEMPIIKCSADLETVGSQRELVMERRGDLLQVHLAEYNALTTRATYWLTLQFAIWPIVVGLWGLLALIWGKLPDAIVLWCGVCLSQAFGLMWYGMIIEIYRAARYIERDLRPMVKVAIGDCPGFWTYEQRNREDRGELLPLVWEWPIAIGAIIIVGSITVLRFPSWGASDYFASVFNGVLALAMVGSAIASGRIRREIVDAGEE